MTMKPAKASRSKGLTKEELLKLIRGSEEESVKPAAVRELFNVDDDLTLKTETPPRMVLPLVRMKILEAAADVGRTKSLVQIFIEEYDRRMISLNRKGRLELLGALQALAESEGGEEIPMR